MTVQYDPFDPETRQDPHPVYARLRAEAPVQGCPAHGFFVVSRDEDIRRMLRDTTTWSSRFGPGLGFAPENSGALVGVDPPEHDFQRALIGAVFGPRAIAGYEEEIRQLAVHLLEELAPLGSADLIPTYAERIPLVVICRLLGFEDAPLDTFRRYTHVATLGVMGGKLFIAWRGTGNNRLNVMSSTNGTTFGNKVTLTDTTPSGPALVGLGAKLLLAWRGVGNNQLNVMQSTNGTAFSHKVTLGETTVSRPGLHASGGRAILTWQGNGNQFLNALVSSNGSAWGSKLTSSQTCIDGPAVSSIGTSLVWGWDGTDTNHHLNAMLFNIV